MRSRAITDATGYSVRPPDQVDRLAHRSAGGYDVVDDQDAPGELRADDGAAFAVIFGLLAIEAVAHIAPGVGERDRDRGDERYPLVCRTEQGVESDAAGEYRFRVELGQLFQRRAVVEQPASKKYGDSRPALVLNSPKRRTFVAIVKRMKSCLKSDAMSEVRYSGALTGAMRGVRSRAVRLKLMKIITLNLNGIRSAARKGFFEWLPRQRADVVCVQELKAQPGDITPEMRAAERLQGVFPLRGEERLQRRRAVLPARAGPGRGRARQSGDRRRRAAISAPISGRSVISVYLPSGSAGEHRQAVKFKFMEYFFGHLGRLAGEGREVILCGDWNIAHREIDLKNWRGNRKNSGFLPEEREWLTRVFEDLEWVDVFRRIDRAPSNTRGGRTAARRGRRTSAGASTTRSGRRESRRRRATRRSTRRSASRTTRRSRSTTTTRLAPCATGCRKVSSRTWSPRRSPPSSSASRPASPSR